MDFYQQTFDKLTTLDFERAEYEQCIFVNCDLSNADFTDLKFVECEFDGCGLNLVNLAGATLNDVKFRNCKMLGWRFDQANQFALSFSFDNCIVNDSSFFKCKLKKSVFVATQFHHCDFVQTDLTETNFHNCDLKDAMFENTNLQKADLRTAINFSINPEINQVKKAKFSLVGLRGLLEKYDLIVSGLLLLLFLGCSDKRKEQAQALDLTRGEITLCGSGVDQFGTVNFSLSCSEETRADFNLATALLHSFEYTEAEKMFAKVIDQDPNCVMAYWGAAMCNFHPLWQPPTPKELEKGAKIIEVARTIATDKSSRESDYIEAIATIYDNWKEIDQRTRVAKFEGATRKIYEKYPDDKEAAVFYSLALDAAADPADKTFKNQRKAGDILNKMFVNEPNHPGIAHYLIHTYDYPELAGLGLDAARKYASIAAASAHAQHMPSHIFTRLGLWDEAIESNLRSVSAAQCYAQNVGAKGHWDEELHGLDYLVYSYLQQAKYDEAFKQVEYLKTIKEIFPENFKVTYAFASIPARYAVERKDWTSAANLEFYEGNFSWNKYPWERSNINLARLLGDVHIGNLTGAKHELARLQSNYDVLIKAKDNYKANFVLIQVKTGEGWIRLKEGNKKEAIALMTEAADLEDKTSKHPVTPGEIIPARELLADMYMEIKDYKNALASYEADLVRHPNRYNGVKGKERAEKELER
ncbi:MAG: pentapeptide repeat-containing protein [Bacteroidota bacterium]